MDNEVIAGFRLSPQQKRLWLDPEGGASAQAQLLLEGAVDTARLKRAFEQVLDRHEILRTSFPVPPGMKLPVQRIAESGPLDLTESDLTGLPAAEQEGCIAAMFEEELTWPLDLRRGIPLSVSLVALAADRRVLSLRLPALSTDAAGLRNLLAEIVRAYAGEIPEAAEEDGPVQYADLSEWQHELLESADTADGRGFWEKLLAEPFEEPAPPGRRREPGEGYEPRSVAVPLSGVGGRVERLAGRLGTPVASVLLAAWSALLARSMEAPEIELGLVCDGRRHEVLREALGLLTKVLPLRLRCAPEEPFELAVLRVAGAADELARYHEYFDAGGTRWASLPLGFELADWTWRAEAGGVTFSVLRAVAPAGRTPLRLSCWRGRDGLAGRLLFDGAAFAEPAMRQLAERFAAFLENAVADPRRPAGEIEALGEAERRLLFAALNGADRPYGPALPIHRLFEAQAARSPEAPALAFEGAAWTYAELDGRADRVARALAARGVGLEARVGVFAERSPEMVAAVLGVLKAGAAFVPLDPSYPAERLAFMMEDAGISVLLTQSRLLGSLPGRAAAPLCVDDLLAGDEGEAAPPVRVEVPGEALAYVIYTSGSTGRPKGVMVSHAAIGNHLGWVREVYPLGPGDSALQKTPLSFDVAVRELFWPLTAGARLVVARPGGHQDSRYLARLAAEEGIAVLNFVPSLLRAFLEEPEAGSLPSLRRIISGGEALTPDLRNRCFERLGAALNNQYGPTETAVTATFWTVDPEDRRDLVPIGRPIANTRACVLDERMQPVFLGSPGELYVGGAGLARGYLGRPDLTAERFVPSPQGEGERLYRTGDLVRVAPEGALEFLGRVDQQVKLRGLRVELGEIESVLANLPGVGQAVVAVREGGAGDPRLVAYLVPRDGAGLPAAEELRQRARVHLPESMVPTAFVTLGQLPLTPSGKVDRRALPAPEEESQRETAAPKTQAEELLAGLFCQLLGRRSVGRDDDFFRLGGHSLLGTQLIARVREAFRLDLPLRTVFEAPTVAGLAGRVEAGLREDGPEAPPLCRRAREGDLPLSFAQRRLWFLHRLEPGSAAYNIPGGVRLRGALDLDRFAAVLAEIVRRHEALRTVFPARSGQPAQEILPAGPVAMPRVDLRALPEEVREREALRLAEAEARTPFDLSRGPLLRLRVLLLGPEDHLVTVTLHHIVSDGWSRGVLVREVVALYRAAARGEASPLPALPVQYVDYAAWQQEWLSGETLAREIAYWKRQLGVGTELLQLPTDRPRPAVYGYRGRQLPIVWPASVARSLAALSRERETTLFMTLLGIFQILLARYSGQESVRVGTPVAGRDRLELEDLIGFFVNTLVLATDLSGSPSVGEALRRVRGVALDAHAHQNVPFERLVDELQPQRNLSHSPLFQVAFALQNAPRTRFELPGLELRLVDLDTRTAKFDLTLGLAEEGEGLRGSFEYNTDLFDEATVARAAGHLERLAVEAAAHPDRPIWELPWLTPAETAHLLALAGRGERYETGCLHRLFERQAVRAPEAVALRFGEASLSYGELDRWANRLAHRLRSLGVGPEDAVALCAEPSFELLAGLLGILKAGAAYVPLDPAHPQERLAFTLEDSAARALVTQERLAGRFPAGLPRICLDGGDGRLDGYPGERPDAGSLPEQRAYVIYTSGSTGRPKGVAVTHANAVRLFAATREGFGFGPDDVWTLFHSASFDFSVWEIWGALLYGGRLVIVPHGVSRSPEDFHALLGREGVTVLNQTPSAFRQLVRVAAETGERRPSLRSVIFGGEALELQSLRPWFELYGDRRPQLVNMYGITETTVHVTWRPVGLPDLAASGSVIGRPIPDLRLDLLDRAGGLVPVGVPGEIHVGGAGLARGYLGRPELTAERFIPDGWSGESGARLYRSGDLARRLPDGDLEYLGRIDEQVKVRGFRIELGEIEAALTALPGVAGAAVLARDDGRGGRRLAAWVVPAGEAVAVETLRRRLAERLPDYMVPAQFVFLPALPLTANGKLDRRALPDPGEERPGLAEAYAAPSTAVEEILAGVWSRVLGVREVGVHDNFFSLGGDSILSIQIVALARERGIELSLHQIFQHQTIAELAPEIRLVTEDEIAERPGPFELLSEADRRLLPTDVEDAYPLARLQDGMLFHMRMAEAEPPYHNIDSFHLRGRFDEAAFAEAWRRVVARHPVLRTSFDLGRYGEPLQLVHRAAEPGLTVEDLRGLSRAEQEERIDGFIRSRRSQPLDLARPPLLRFHVHRRTDDTFQLTLIENHAILDGWSLHSTLSEVFQLQLALLDGREVPAEPTPPVLYRDFIALERRLLESGESRRFWEERIAGRTFLEIPRGASAAATGGPRVRIRRAPIPGELSDRLKRAAREAAVPAKSILLAAHLAVLARLSGRTDVLTGLVSNGRPEVAGGDLVRGLFLNTLPFRFRLLPGSWAGLAQAVFDEERAILPHRRYPLAAIQQGSREPLFEAAFNYIHFHVVDDALKPGGFEILDTRIQEATNFTLSATFGEDPGDGGKVFLQAAYDSHRLDEDRILAIERLYRAALEAVAADPQAPHEALDGLAESERRSLSAWSAAPALDRLPPLPVHEIFFRQAGATPGRTAVRCGDRSLDYAALARSARGIAERLAGLAVGPEVRVGLFLRPDVELVAAVLGVLAAGGAYVPIDPTYPRERVEWLLADSGVAAVLTEESLLPSLPGVSVPVVRLDGLEAAAAGGAGAPPAAVLDDNLAYVIYTSGSTGRPNGAMVSHGGLRNYLAWCLARYGVEEGTGAPVHSSVGFDLTVTALFAPLVAGRTVTLLDPGADGLLRALESGPGFSLIKLTPAHLDLVSRQIEPGRLAAAARSLVVGGEALFGASLADWRRHAPEARIFNEYGPTETVVGCCVHEVPPGEPEAGPVPIGRPIAGLEVHLLDEWLRPVPAGAVGEIFIGGAGLGRGYLGRPERTAERWVPHPASPEPGRRLYRTGDLARRLPDGELVYLGRRDHQIKIRGYRIEPGEVEAALERHPAVRQAAVVARRDRPDDVRLVAFLTVRDGERIAPGELRELLHRTLPAYMVPGAFVPVDALPLTEHGKVDRRRLLAGDPAASRAGSAPRGAVETAELLLRWSELNDTAMSWEPASGVHQLIAGRAARHPDRLALTGDRGRLTYGELESLANRLARFLGRLGLGPGAVVAVAVERSPEMVAALLGALKAGAAYLPLDPAFPRERLAFMLADSGASALVTQESLAAQLPPHPATVLLDRDRPRIDAEPADDPGVPAEPEDLAYILYTSGSTGRPKGVEIPRGALLNFLRSMAGCPGLAEGERLLAVTSLSFDISGLELFLPLLAGAEVEIASRETAADAARLRQRLAEASVMQATPATWRMLVDSGWTGDGRLRALCGGEPLPRDLAADLLARAGEVWNLYGPTETTIWSTLQRVGTPAGDEVVPIGRPIANTRVFALDEHLGPAAPGEPGELHIGGSGLARGYHGRPELTAAAFVPDPFAAEPGARLYRTGDRGTLGPDGALRFIGRTDHQVKVRGYRIELGEVEAALRRHPAVREAVAVAVNAGGEPRLVAHVVPAAGLPPGRELREHLLTILPEYMVPAEIVALDALPLLPNRKVDRGALARRGGGTSARPEEGGNPVEELLLGMWRELLRVEAVGRDESFFDLGGHSLLATRLLSRVAQTFGVELPLRALFEEPAVGRLARRIEAALESGGGAAPPIERVPRGEPLPLSFAQQRLWFLDQLEPGGAAYNMPLAVRLEGALGIPAFALALSELVRRHEALRTRFREIGGEPWQLVDEPEPVALPVADLGGLEPRAREAEARGLAAEEAARPFDLARGPVLRARLVRLAEAEHVLLLTVHHIGSDGWSMDVMVRELGTLYEAFRAGRPSPLPELPVQYADFAAWQRRWLAGEALDAQLGYWRRQLAGAPAPTRLPFRREPRGPVSARGAHRSFAVPGGVVEALRRLAQEERVTLYMVLLAAFEALLYRATGASDLLVGTDLANRRRAEVEGLIGFFVNVLPVRLSVAGQPTFRELLARVREVALGVYAHQDVPLEKLAEELAPGRGQGRSPFFEMLFVFLPPAATAEAAGLRLSRFEAGSETSRFDLVLFLSESAGEVRGSFVYRTDLFDAADVERLGERFQALLASAAERPEARLDSLDFLTERERRERAMELEEQEKASFSKFKRMKPKTVILPQGELVRTGHLGAGESLPLVVEPNAPDLDLAGWAAGNPEFFETNLARYGALLFRGFHLPAVTEFERFASAVCPTLFGEYGDLPRAGEGRKVYNSTPYPIDKTILFHNESSHMHQWPRKQFFYCVIPSETGGETPIVDCRRIYRLLDPELRARFESKGLMYVRNFTEGLDVRWQDFFMTEDRAEVEAYCRENGIELTWRGDRLQTRQAAPAVIEHPKTGEKVFFNQIQLHHVSCVEPEVRESLTALFAPDELPRNVFYGDGSPIADEDVQAVLSLYWQESVAAPWQKGDALVVDNMLVAHARNPFTGARKIAVAMGEMFRREWL